MNDLNPIYFNFSLIVMFSLSEEFFHEEGNIHTYHITFD